MTLNFSKFKTLRSRIFFFFVSLLLLVQFVAFWFVSMAIQNQEELRLKSELASASTIFETIFSTSRLTLNNFNQVSNRILAENFNDDTRSFLIALESFRNRVNADIAMSIDKSGLIKAQIIQESLMDDLTQRKIGPQQGLPFPYSLDWLSLEDGNKFYQIDKTIYQFSISEVNVGRETIGWIGFGRVLDDHLAYTFFKLSNFHINFYLSDSYPNKQEQCTLVGSSMEKNSMDYEKVANCQRIDDSFETSTPLTLGRLGAQQLTAVLYGSREDLLSTIKQRWLFLVALAGLTFVLSLLGAYLIAGSISRPVRTLVQQAKHISQGNYETSVELNDSSEFGQLADEFNQMQIAVLEREHEILHNSSHDPLTDLPNRNRLFKTLKKWREQGQINHAIFLIRINHIKAINESLGHSVGDQVIKVVSERLRNIKNIDLLSHLRTDEFVILVSQLSKASVIRWIEQITQAMETPYCADGMTLHLQTNIGVVLSSDSNDNPGNLIRMADSALQMARNQKQAFKLYDKSQDVDQAERLNLMNDLHNAIAENQLKLFYQPKLELATGKVTHVEALIRWFHPEKGMIPPDKFIPIAENTGQIDLLTLWVLEEAAKQHALWIKQGFVISIAINVSAQNLKNDKFFTSVNFILDQYDLNAKAIQLEVTESAVVDDPVTAIALLSKFKEFGMHLSIDDYGTGYSSLAQLKQLPVHELKIDMSFIQKLPDDEDDKIIVKSTIELAHNMGLSVVAEGVETKKGLDWLAAHDCEFIQGYYIARPQPAEEFIAWLKQSDYV